jgi:hypothetical protein
VHRPLIDALERPLVKAKGTAPTKRREDTLRHSRSTRALDAEHAIAGDELRAIKRYIAMRTEALPGSLPPCAGTLTRHSVKYLVRRRGGRSR